MERFLVQLKTKENKMHICYQELAVLFYIVPQLNYLMFYLFEISDLMKARLTYLCRKLR